MSDPNAQPPYPPQEPPHGRPQAPPPSFEKQHGYGQQAGYGQQGWQPQQGYQPPPPAPLSPGDERTWGMFAHLSAILASFIGLTFLGPLIVFLVLKDRSRFVRGHSLEALNMTISLIVYEIVLWVGGAILAVVLVGYVLWVAAVGVSIAALVFTIMAAVAANQGRVYRYPLILRLVH